MCQNTSIIHSLQLFWVSTTCLVPCQPKPQINFPFPSCWGLLGTQMCHPTLECAMLEGFSVTGQLTGLSNLFGKEKGNKRFITGNVDEFAPAPKHTHAHGIQWNGCIPLYSTFTSVSYPRGGKEDTTQLKHVSQFQQLSPLTAKTGPHPLDNKLGLSKGGCDAYQEPH